MNHPSEPPPSFTHPSQPGMQPSYPPSAPPPSMPPSPPPKRGKSWGLILLTVVFVFSLLASVGLAAFWFLNVDGLAVEEPTDAGFDAGHDAGWDAGYDAGFDAGHDAGHDAGFDAGEPDPPPRRRGGAWWAR